MATIRKRRDKWQVQIRRAGVRPFSKSFAVRKDAVAWARQMEVQADRADLPADPAALQKVTLGDLVRRYRDTVSPRKKTAATETIVLNAFLTRQICRRRLSELRTEDFATYRDQRLQTIKPSSLSRELTPVRHLFEVARDEWGLPIRENPLVKLRLQETDQRRERRLRTGEYERLIKAGRTCRNKLIVPIIELAIETGMRRSEILGIKGADINLDRRMLVLPETKNGSSRTIPLSYRALALLQPLIGETQVRIFPLSGNAVRLAWEKLRRRANITDLHFHDLRHEAISRFFDLGLTVPEVASISGHKDARMLLRYAHASNQNVLFKLDQQIRDFTVNSA